MEIIKKIKNFLISCKRTLKVSKKPSTEEFLACLKFSTIISIIFGIIALVLSIVVVLIY